MIYKYQKEEQNVEISIESVVLMAPSHLFIRLCEKLVALDAIVSLMQPEHHF